MEELQTLFKIIPIIGIIGYSIKTFYKQSIIKNASFLEDYKEKTNNNIINDFILFMAIVFLLSMFLITQIIKAFNSKKAPNEFYNLFIKKGINMYNSTLFFIIIFFSILFIWAIKASWNNIKPTKKIFIKKYVSLDNLYYNKYLYDKQIGQKLILHSIMNKNYIIVPDNNIENNLINHFFKISEQKFEKENLYFEIQNINVNKNNHFIKYILNCILFLMIFISLLSLYFFSFF